MSAPMYAPGPMWVPARTAPLLVAGERRQFVVASATTGHMAIAFLHAGRLWSIDPEGHRQLYFDPEWIGDLPYFPPLPQPPDWDDSPVGWRVVSAPPPWTRRQPGRRTPTHCGYCAYEESDGELEEQCGRCKAIDAARSSGAITAIVMVANVATVDGYLYPVAEVRRLADGKTLFYDEALQALIYRGPAP